MSHDTPVIKALFERRSIRKLKSDPIPVPDLKKMLECMEAAPSAGNLQPWRFIVVRNQEIQDKLCALSFDQQAVSQAPVVFAVCAVGEESATQYAELGRDFFCIQDTSCAVQNLLLAVHDMGYGAVWIGVVKDKEIAECLDCAKGERPVALIPVGLPDEVPAPMERKGIDKVTRYID